VPLVLVLSVGAGAVIAVSAAFARELLASGLGTDTDVADVLGLPTLGAIPDLGVRRGPTPTGDGADIGDLVVLPGCVSDSAEAFRRLRKTALFSTVSPRIILVTGVGIAEGKTVASVNLAASLAEGGARVLLIDAELRRPRCHALLGVANAGGLADYLAGEADLATVVRDVPVPRVAFLPAGTATESPTSLIGSGHMHALLSRLRRAYDCLVIDAPGILAASDALLLARDADAVVLVVGARATSPALLVRTRDRLAAARVPVAGVLLNHAPVVSRRAGLGASFFR
jgi:capsular exopolysaccharide synthesis family protein